MGPKNAKWETMQGEEDIGEVIHFRFASEKVKSQRVSEKIYCKKS
jgi:hypothetical protein